MTTPSQIKPPRNSRHQRGAAIIILVLILMLGLITLFTFRMDRKGPELEAERKTAMALAHAKEALLGYSAKDTNRPGSLPCPDANDDGMSIPVDDYTGVTCISPVGRLPWRTLGLPDLRDGYGERFWYAVSPIFSANNAATLNSSILGQITTKDANGAVIHNATTTTGVVAIIIAPGAALTRLGAVSAQNRTCIIGTTCDAQLVCNSPFISVPKCNPINYLDLTVSEDNQDFVAGTTNGFVAGVIKNAAGNPIVNDRMITITARELFNVVTQRMVREFVQKLVENSLVNPYPGSYPFMPRRPTLPPAPPPLDPWFDNQWDTALSSSYSPTPLSNPTQFTLQFANCTSVFTVIRNGASNTISGHC